MTLKELAIGKAATIVTVGGEGALRQHLLDMGLIPGARVSMVKFAPMGDPVEVRINSYELTLRLADAAQIEIKDVADAEKAAAAVRRRGCLLYTSTSTRQPPWGCACCSPWCPPGWSPPSSRNLSLIHIFPGAGVPG